MTPPADPERYKNHRFPGAIISHGVWLSYRFPLSYRDVQEILCERGIDVTHEAIRQWCLKFGQDYANQLRHRRPQPGDKWHLAAVFLTIHGERHDWTCSHDTGHIWEEILPHPFESMSRTLKDLERQAFTVFWSVISLSHGFYRH